MMKRREIIKVVKGIQQSEGDGATVMRSIGTRSLDTVDPFLMLDEFFVSPPAGFPDHPHRGFETVTYMLSGSFKHEDFCGHSGTLKPGDLQWMTAGKGIVHSEMPATPDVNHGLQLWINLDKSFKLVDPSYQELQAADIPGVQRKNMSIKVLAGEIYGVKSPVRTLTPVLYLYVNLKEGESHSIEIPEGWNSFSYITQGSVEFLSEVTRKVDPHNIVVFGQEGQIEVKCATQHDCSFVIAAGKPLDQPIAKHGPFVMNTREEIQQAFHDYRNGVNGFENANSWKSK